MADPVPGLAGEVTRMCQEICARSQSLHCPQTVECMPNCLAMATATACSREFQVMERCMAAQALDHWECGQDGVAAMRVGYCEDEQGRAVHCMMAKMR